MKVSFMDFCKKIHRHDTINRQQTIKSERNYELATRPK